jgi:hypothetical protein
VLPIFGREGDYESMTSGDQDAALDPDKEDPFTTVGTLANQNQARMAWDFQGGSKTATGRLPCGCGRPSLKRL